jgi:selenocysteine lyase/cysteine desulfurase
MAKEGFFVTNGDFYASTLAEKLGIRDRGGWIRAGLAPYTTEEEVEGFVEVLRNFVKEPFRLTSAEEQSGGRDVGWGYGRHDSTR